MFGRPLCPALARRPAGVVGAAVSLLRAGFLQGQVRGLCDFSVDLPVHRAVGLDAPHQGNGSEVSPGEITG